MPATIAQQIAELTARKSQLRDEMLQSHARTDSQWMRDRVDEMAHLNRWQALLAQRQAVLGPVE